MVVIGSEFQRELDSCHLWHYHVRDHEIGCMLRYRRQSILWVEEGCSGVTAVLKYERQSRGDNLFIVNDEDAALSLLH